MPVLSDAAGMAAVVTAVHGVAGGWIYAMSGAAWQVGHLVVKTQQLMKNASRCCHGRPAALPNPQLSTAGRHADRADGTRIAALVHDPWSVTTVAVGTGLQGVVDRLAALGGCLKLSSPPGQGTMFAGPPTLRLRVHPGTRQEQRTVCRY